MPKIDRYEREIIAAFDKGKLMSVATKAELAGLKAAARATALKDRRVSIRLWRLAEPGVKAGVDTPVRGRKRRSTAAGQVLSMDTLALGVCTASHCC